MPPSPPAPGHKKSQIKKKAVMLTAIYLDVTGLELLLSVMNAALQLHAAYYDIYRGLQGVRGNFST